MRVRESCVFLFLLKTCYKKCPFVPHMCQTISKLIYCFVVSVSLQKLPPLTTKIVQNECP